MTLPSDTGDAAGAAQLQTFADALVASLDGVLERLGAGEARILADLANRVEEGAERGTAAGVADVATALAALSELLRDGSARDSVLSPLRAEAAATARATADTVHRETRAAVVQIRDEARQVVAHAVPRIATSWVLVGMLVMLTILTIAIVFDVRGWSGSAYSDGYAAGSRDQALRQAAFYAGLDRGTKTVLDRHNARQARDARLYLHSGSGG